MSLNSSNIEATTPTDVRAVTDTITSIKAATPHANASLYESATRRSYMIPTGGEALRRDGCGVVAGPPRSPQSNEAMFRISLIFLRGLVDMTPSPTGIRI